MREGCVRQVTRFLKKYLPAQVIDNWESVCAGIVERFLEWAIRRKTRVSSEHIVSVARAVFGVPKARAKGVTSAHTTVTMVRLPLIRI